MLKLLPNIFEPLLYTTEEDTVLTTKVWAVKVFLTKKLLAEDAVNALVAFTAKSE